MPYETIREGEAGHWQPSARRFPRSDLGKPLGSRQFQEECTVMR